MGSFSEKKMSEKKYDFLEDIFITISDKWHEKDRNIKLNDRQFQEEAETSVQ